MPDKSQETVLSKDRATALETLRGPVMTPQLSGQPRFVLTESGDSGDCSTDGEGNVTVDTSLDSTTPVTITGNSILAGNGSTEDVSVTIILASTGEAIGYADANGSGGYISGDSGSSGGGDSGGDGGGDGGGGGDGDGYYGY